MIASCSVYCLNGHQCTPSSVHRQKLIKNIVVCADDEYHASSEWWVTCLTIIYIFSKLFRLEIGKIQEFLQQARRHEIPRLVVFTSFSDTIQCMTATLPKKDQRNLVSERFVDSLVKVCLVVGIQYLRTNILLDVSSKDIFKGVSHAMAVYIRRRTVKKCHRHLLHFIC